MECRIACMLMLPLALGRHFGLFNLLDKKQYHYQGKECPEWLLPRKRASPPNMGQQGFRDAGNNRIGRSIVSENRAKPRADWPGGMHSTRTATRAGRIPRPAQRALKEAQGEE